MPISRRPSALSIFWKHGLAEGYRPARPWVPAHQHGNGGWREGPFSESWGNLTRASRNHHQKLALRKISTWIPWNAEERIQGPEVKSMALVLPLEVKQWKTEVTHLEYVSVCIWLISLSMFSVFIYASCIAGVHSFSWLILHCIYMPFFLSIHLLLGAFHLLAIMHMLQWTLVHSNWWSPSFNLFWAHMGHRAVFCLASLGTTKQVSTMAAPFYPTYVGSNFFTSGPALVLFCHRRHCCFCCYHLTGYEAVSHSGFHLHFPNGHEVENLSCVCESFLYLLWRNVYSSPLHILKLSCLEFCCWVLGALKNIYFEYKNLVRCMIRRYFCILWAAFSLCW